MPYAPSGLWFRPTFDAEGRRTGRDFTRDAEGNPQVDDRWDINKHGDIIQIRDRVSSAPHGPPEMWPDIVEPDAEPEPPAPPDRPNNRHGRRGAAKRARKGRR